MKQERDHADDYDAMCDRCLQTRKRSELRLVRGERVTVLICPEGCTPGHSPDWAFEDYARETGRPLPRPTASGPR
jgi:hypothetical protein